MSILQAIILGVVQGVTEFLPISSSGHLVLVPHLLKWHIPSQQSFIFDVLVQLGTLAAVMVYFWKDLTAIVRNFIRGLRQGNASKNQDSRMGWYLLMASIPAGIIGFTLKSYIKEAFQSPTATGAFLLITAIMLWIAERIGKRSRSMADLNWVDALWMGFFQALSPLPGPAAARFSFLMAVPIMLAAGLIAVFDLLRDPNISSFLLPLSIGFLTSAFTGYLTIHGLLRFLTRRPLYAFSIYLLIVGSVTLFAR
jgi:undecaprenyl-diphosphatase